jgi:predicted DNA-binding protein (MmcQ/YjbR family)
MSPAKKKSKHAGAFAALRAAALRYPGAWEDHPWDHTVVKVGKKIFVFLSDDEGLGLSVKLPRSGEAALTMFSWARPTEYGLGKSGWVSAQFDEGKQIPVPMLVEWIDESYRALAPVKLVKQLDAGGAAEPAKKAAAPKARAKKAASKKAARAP